MYEEDSDEDIFVIKHYKPVNKAITVTKAAEIKEKVLNKFKQEDEIIFIDDSPEFVESAEVESAKEKKSSEETEIPETSKDKPAEKNDSLKGLEDEPHADVNETCESFGDKLLEINKVLDDTKDKPSEINKNVDNIYNDRASIKQSLENSKEEPLEIKKVLETSEPETHNLSENNKSLDITLESSITNSEVKENVQITPQRKRPRSRSRSRSKSNTPKKKIDEYFTPTKSPNKTKSPKKKKSMSPNNNNELHAHESPSTKRRKSTPPKIKVEENVRLSPSIKKNINRFSLNFEASTSTDSLLSKVKRSIDRPTSEPVLTGKSESSSTMCHLFQKIVHDEMEKQLILEEMTVSSGETFERLIAEDELEIVEKFFKLDMSSQQLFVRMYCRVHKWHRLSDIKYEDIGLNLMDVYNSLKVADFFDTNINEMNLKTQLELFKVGELNFLCRNFNVILPPSAKKDKIIETIITDSRRQLSAFDMMQKSKMNSRQELLKREIAKTLKDCFRLNEKVVTVFNRIVLLFSLVHDVEDHNKRVSETIFLLFKEYAGHEKHFKFQLTPSVIFKTRNDFLRYEKAVRDKQDLDDAVSNKNFEAFNDLAKKAKAEFGNLLKDEDYISRFSTLPSFLKRFSAGSVYARMLTTYLEKFKNKASKPDQIETASMLLDQNLFNVSKKGKWYELLSMAYESTGRQDLSAKILLVGTDDILVNEVQKLTLRLRGQTLLKKKTNGIKDEQLRERLDDVSTICNVQEPPSIEIKGKAAMDGVAGYKSVYVVENEHGQKSYSSVEEQAIYYYKKNEGFSNGMHVEGAVIQTIFLLLFFDIIYQVSPPGVFQSPYQAAPLDLYSKLFYENRKDAIDTRLIDMISWSQEELMQRIRLVYYDNFNVNCVVSWNDDLKPELYCDIIQCIGVERLVPIMRRLVENFRVVRAGFPDLTLWNPATKKIKFVEVKSPNDRLSSGQRVWLNFLRTIDVNCEVCNVKNVGGRKIRN